MRWSRPRGGWPVQDASVAVARAGEWVTVEVSSAVASGSWGGSPLRARATAVAQVEP